MNVQGCKPRVTVDRLLGRKNINNEAIAAFVGEKDAKPKSKGAERGLEGAEKERKKDSFRMMMRRKTTEAKAAHAKKKTADKARKAGG